MTEEQITANKNFWQKWFNVSSCVFPWCPLIGMAFLKTALPFFIVLGVSLAITIFISVKYYRAQTAVFTMLKKEE